MFNLSAYLCTSFFWLLPLAWPGLWSPRADSGAVNAHVAICIFLQSKLYPLETARAIGRKLVLCLFREMSPQDTDFVIVAEQLNLLGQAGSSHPGALGMSWGTFHPTLS